MLFLRQKTLDKSGWDPAYSPDITSSDYYLFQMQHALFNTHY